MRSRSLGRSLLGQHAERPARRFYDPTHENKASGTALIQSALGDEAFASIYKGKRFIAKEPEYANARAMWKFGMYVLDPAERTIHSPAVTKGWQAKTSRASTVEPV
jgi:hypothetical protein